MDELVSFGRAIESSAFLCASSISSRSAPLLEVPSESVKVKMSDSDVFNVSNGCINWCGVAWPNEKS